MANLSFVAITTENCDKDSFNRTIHTMYDLDLIKDRLAIDFRSIIVLDCKNDRFGLCTLRLRRQLIPCDDSIHIEKETTHTNRQLISNSYQSKLESDY